MKNGGMFMLYEHGFVFVRAGTECNSLMLTFDGVDRMGEVIGRGMRDNSF